MAVGSSSASPAKLTDGEVGGLEQVSNQPEVAVAPTGGSLHGEEALGRGQGTDFTKYCHQCHHKTTGFFPACKKQTKGKFCNIKYCERCLWNRYKEKVEEVSVLETWHCPKCRGSCNCCTCRKRQGLNPSGKVATAEASGSSAPELLSAEGPPQLQQLSVHSKDDINSENPAIALLEGKSKGVSSTFKRKRAKGSIPEVVLPQGTEITEIAGIDFHPEDISHALQFLEFCASFKKCLALKEGEGESILREIASGGRAGQRNMSLTVRFNKQLLSYLPQDLEENSPVTTRAGKNSWLHGLRRLATRSSLLPQNLDLEQLCAEDGYDNLNFSQKLRLLNFLCDESLNTTELRSCIDKKLKKEQGKVLAKKQEKLKIVDVLAKNADHEAAETKVEAAIGEMSKLKGIVPSVKQGLKNFRIEPIRLGVDCICWRLNFCVDASNLFIEEVGSADGQPEKWFTYNVEEEKEMERYLISARKREKSRNRKVVVDDKTNKARENEDARKMVVDNLTNNTEEDETRKVVVDDLTNTLKEDEEARKVVVDDLTNNTRENEETRKVVLDDLTNSGEDEDVRKMVDDLTIKAGEDAAIFGSSSNIEQ